VLILREDGTECAPNETGELCVVGSQLALGYWNNPEESARAFTANPLNKAFYEEMYHTGDLAYKCEDGLIMYVGRKDSQIKLRGNRIEMGDIENAARTIAAQMTNLSFMSQLLIKGNRVKPCKAQFPR
jgi:non-ribosomal peptide synthetase component F